MKDIQGIVSFDEIKLILPIQYSKRKRALDLFCHRAQSVQIEGFLLFNQLYRNITVCLNFGPGQLLLAAQIDVIVNCAVVCKGELHAV